MKNLLICLLLAACGARTTPPPYRAGETVYLTLPALDGGEVSFESWRGRPVLVHFMTTWSLAAQVDLEELRAAQKAVPDLVLVEISLDENYRLIDAWRAGAGVDWTILLPIPALLEGGTPLGKPTTVPTTVLVGRDGTVRWGHIGGLPAGTLARVVKEQGG
jgi:hypothetical protein